MCNDIDTRTDDVPSQGPEEEQPVGPIEKGAENSGVPADLIPYLDLMFPPQD